MKQSIWIHGPQGCGKTLNGHRLRRHFGLDHVVEADELRPGETIGQGALVLAIDPPTLEQRSRDMQVMSFAQAMRLAGFARSPT